MSQLNVTSLKHEGASGDNITLDSNGNVGIGGSVDNRGGYGRCLQISGTEAAIELESGSDYGYLAQNGTNMQFRNVANGNALFYTNNTERVRIDSAGRVTMPYQPAFWARRTAGNVNGPVTIVFNDAQLNVGGHYNAGSGTFTVPIAGVYEFHVSLLTQGGSYRCQAEIRVNGSGRTTLEQASGYSYQQGSMTLMLSLAASDFVTVTLTTSSDGMYGVGYNSFSGRLVS